MKLLVQRIKSRLRRHYDGFRRHSATPVATPAAPVELLYNIDSLSYGELTDHVKIAGWCYHSHIDNLSVQLDGRVIASFSPNLSRADVCAVYPQIPAHATPGFQRTVQLEPAWLNNRGSSCLSIVANINGQAHELAASRVFSRQHYSAARVPEQHAERFYFTVGSSNITLGGFGDFKEKLGPFSIGACQLGFMAPVLYMRSTKGRAEDWNFDPAFDESRLQGNGTQVLADSLSSILQFAKKTQIPCVIGLNGGIWSDSAGTCPEWDLTDHLEEDIHNCQWNQNNEVMPDDYLKHLTGALHAPELSRSLTLNHYNQTVRAYKKRNLQQAAQAILAFAKDNPELYIASNLDPDCYQNPFFEGEQWYDFSPQTLQQFRDWLAGTGAYAGELKHSLQHTLYSLEQLNQECATCFASWEQVQPPREHPSKAQTGTNTRLLQLWEQFRRHVVHRHYCDLADWLVESGISPAQIFSSQGFTAPRLPIDPFALYIDSPLKNHETGGMCLEGSLPDQGHIGAILYGESARNNIRTENGLPFFQSIRALDPDWAVVEFNPADLRDPPKQLPDYAFAWDCLRQIFNHGARYINMLAWNGSTAKDLHQDFFSAHMALRDTPLQDAVIDFMLIHSDVPRGSVCYSFGSNKHACAEGWTSNIAQVQARTDGLHVPADIPVILQAPEPYLLSGKRSLAIRLNASDTTVPEFWLEVDGRKIPSSSTIQPDGNILRIDFHPLPETLERLALHVAAGPVVLQRLVFS